MNIKTLIAVSCLVCGCHDALATAETAQEAKPADAPQMTLPPGWTEADMQACMIAATPGEMQARLAKDVGVWQGKHTMWMAPGAPPMTSDCTVTVTSIMDGRFTRSDMAGEIPGMGPYTGLGIVGFDNTAGRFEATWVDNHSTGIMVGVGALSADGKSITWQYSYECPVTKKPAVMRQVETITGPNSKTLEMWGNEPKSGQEYKVMTMELTRQSASASAEH